MSDVAKYPVTDAVLKALAITRRGVEEFWIPHFRFLETNDEHFDHPAQMRSPTGAPLHGRWRIYGISLPDEVLRKVYYANALKYLPGARAAVERRLFGPAGAITPRTLNRAIHRHAPHVVITGAQLWIAPFAPERDAEARRFVSWVNTSAQHYRYR